MAHFFDKPSFYSFLAIAIGACLAIGFYSEWVTGIMVLGIVILFFFFYRD